MAASTSLEKLNVHVLATFVCGTTPDAHLVNSTQRPDAVFLSDIRTLDEGTLFDTMVSFETGTFLFVLNVEDTVEDAALLRSFVALMAKAHEFSQGRLVGLIETPQQGDLLRDSCLTGLGWPAFALCASSFAPTARPRLYWCSIEPVWPAGTGVEAATEGRACQVLPAAHRTPWQAILENGWAPLAVRFPHECAAKPIADD